MTRSAPDNPRADDSDAPLPMDSVEASAIGGASGSGPASGSGTAAASAGASAGASGSGVTTGGFDTMLGKLVVKSGLVTTDDIDLCNNLLAESSSVGDQPRTLSDVLLENEFVTKRQLARVREEFETRKDTQRIPGYKIIEKLGAGAMATVFLARQLSLDRDVAIKVLPKKFSDNANFIERFYKEGRAAAKLNHPNIVAAYDVGQAGEHHYFVMEYVDGKTVYDLIKAKKRVSEERAVEIVMHVARALQHAHERGFIHRDIKPKNIMLDSKGRAKLADLGLARAMSDKQAAEAEAGRAYGTPYYISPEQIRGELKIGPEADVYGLGATFYHMVAGKVPFEGKNPSAVMHKHLKSELTPPDHLNPKLSSGCAMVIEMMLAKDPRDRYHNAGDLLEDLDLVKKGESPHFAKRNLDFSTIAETITGPADLPPVRQQKRTATGEADTGSPVTTLLMVGLAISFILNLVLLALWLTS